METDTKPNDLQDVRRRVLDAQAQLTETFIQREDCFRAMILAAISQTPCILVGDPGTAKTAAMKSWFSHIADARKFVTLCGSFATEDKIFGPIDLAAFQRSEWGRATKGRLAAVELAGLDELMKSNDGCLNGQLTVLNEREYEGQKVPLRQFFAASNWPEIKARTENVAALWDRLVLRVEVKEVEGEDAEIQLLEAGERVGAYKPRETLTIAELDAAKRALEGIEIKTAMRRNLVRLRHRLVKENVVNTGRRMVTLQMVLRASAWLAGRAEVTLEDFDALRFGLWHDKEQIDVVAAVLDTIDHETVTKAMKLIDEASQQHRQNQGLPAQRALQEAPHVCRKIREMMKQVQTLITETGLTKKGRDRVRAATTELRARYDALNAKVEAAVGQQ